MYRLGLQVEIGENNDYIKLLFGGLNHRTSAGDI